MINIGETTVLSTADNGNGNLLVAQQATLPVTSVLQSMSFYVTNATGKLRLGVYDAGGLGGGPGNKVAETGEITPTVGWNEANVIAPCICLGGHTGLRTSRATTISHFPRHSPDRPITTRNPMDRCRQRFPHRLKARSFTGLCSQSHYFGSQLPAYALTVIDGSGDWALPRWRAGPGQRQHASGRPRVCPLDR